MRKAAGLVIVTSLAASGVFAETPPRSFDIPSADGMLVHGQADLPDRPASAAVIMVAGTGPFDRDVHFGRSGTPGDWLFKALAARITARGGMAVRYDKRGIEHTGAVIAKWDRKVMAKVSTTTMRDDLRAVYDWTRSPTGLDARCVVIFAHSEGMIHTGRLAASGAPAPDLVIGMGAAMQSPVADIRWQMTRRDAFSLAQMDANHDGATTNDEVEANWRYTPSGGADNLGPYLNQHGKWTEADLDQLEKKSVHHL